MLWSIRAALLLFALVLVIRLMGGTRTGRQSIARMLWTIGFGLFLLHVGLAFATVHHWSHGAAYRETARRTAELFGTQSGAGLYFNYLFILVWAVDVCWWWIAGLVAYDRRPRWIGGVVYGFMVFMAFNATVVFEHGVVRWMGALISALLVVLCIARLRWARAVPSDERALTRVR